MLTRYARQEQVLALSPLASRYEATDGIRRWPSHDGTLERILVLQPRLVLTGEYNALTLRRRLQELGVRVEVLPLPQSLSQVRDYQQRFLSLLGLPDQGEPLPPAPAAAGARPRILLLGANGIGTGRNTLEDGVLQQAGWQNYLQGEGYLRLDLERIVQEPPDAILWAVPEAQALANLFAEHPALRRALPEERWLYTDHWSWQCPGPWTWKLIEQLQQWRDRYSPH